MKKLLVLFLALLTIGIAEAQKTDDDFSIKIVVTTATLRNGEFTTDIYKSGNNLKIVYSFRDSLGRAYYKDKERLALNRALRSNMEDSARTTELFNDLESLEKKYSYYSKDSLLLDSGKEASFSTLLERVVSAPVEELQNLEESRKRILLDGANYAITIRTGDKIKQFNVDSPDPETHPLIYQLTRDSEKLYKREKQNNFFDKMSTLSY